MSYHLIYAAGLPDHLVTTVRIIALSVSCVSITACLLFLYMFLMIHPTRRVFRHYLIAMLVFFDFIKALSVLVYTTKFLHNSNNPTHALVNGLGWMTIFGMEGADMTILFFAVHMALLIFHKEVKRLKFALTPPAWMIQHVKFTQRYTYHADSRDSSASEEQNEYEKHHGDGEFYGTSLSAEGTLYKHRYAIAFICFLFPILVSSISFYIPNIYQGYNYFVFFRVWTAPWYFTWIFRHVVNVCIITIYIAIYVYVLMQFKKVSNSFKKRKLQEESRHREGSSGDADNDHEYETYDGDDDDDDEMSNGVMLNTFGESIWYKIFKVCSMLIFPDVNISAKLYGHSLNTEEDMENITRLKADPQMREPLRADSISTDEILGLEFNNPHMVNKTQISKQIQNLMFEEAMERFNNRKAQILNQMKIIFIYPISYVLIWLFPLINHYQIVRLKREVPWSTIAASICQSLNGFVDTLVFLIREKPWLLTTAVETAETTPYENSSRQYNGISGYDIHGWRYYISWLPGFNNYGKLSLEEASICDNSLQLKHLSDKSATYGRSDDVAIYEARRDSTSSQISKYGSRRSSMNTRLISDSTNTTDIHSASGSSIFNQEELDLKDFLNSKPPPAQTSTAHKLSISKPSLASIMHKPNTSNDRRHSHTSWRSRSLTSSHMSRSTSSGGALGLDHLKMSAKDNGRDPKEHKVDWNLNVFDTKRKESFGASTHTDTLDEENNSSDDEKLDIFDFLKSKPH